MSGSRSKRPSRRARRARRRTPVFLQNHPTECGAACVRSVLAYFGKWVSLDELREACSVGRDGSSAADLLHGARAYGLDARGWRRTREGMRQAPLPAILHWEFTHFVVLEGFRAGRYHLNDPSFGHLVVDEETFDRGFTGVVLHLEPGPEFEPNGKPPGAVRRLWSWLRDYKPALVLATLFGLLLGLSALATPLLLSVLVDHVLAREQYAWRGVVIGAMVALGGVTYLLTLLQLQAIRRLAVAISVTRSDRFLTRLFRLPMQFFTGRLAGDLMDRMHLIDSLALKGAGQLVVVVVEVVMCVAFLAAMVAYHPLLALAVLLLAVLLGVLARGLARLGTAYNHRARREQGLLLGMAMAGLRALESIRATASENGFFARWSGYQARELNARQSFEELRHVVHALPGLFHVLGSALVLGVGGWQVIAGNLTVGALMAYYVLAGNFLRPIGRLMQFTVELQTMAAHLQRLDDVFEAPVEAEPGDGGHRPGTVATLNGRLRLTGQVELRDVTFGYQRNQPPVLRKVNLTIRPGERVAVVGPSGSGKTSLALLIAGVYQPWSGEILFDGHLLQDIPRDVFAASVGMVDQHPVLFRATVRENLTFWNPTVPDQHVVAAAHDACIHDVIVTRPGGYDALLEERGRNFSGGQQQRLEIARALALNPTLLILDEATSSLDAVTEVRIDNALRRRGCACLIVAHRLSTIRDSNLIVVLMHGRELLRGRHDELMAAGGLYRKLIGDL